MTQGMAMSDLEALTNVVVSWIVALCSQALVVPVMGLSVTVAQHLGIGAVFTAVSLVKKLPGPAGLRASGHSTPGGRVKVCDLDRGTGGGRQIFPWPEFGPGVERMKGR